MHTIRGLVTYYILFLIDLASRSVHIAGVTPHPDNRWMTQIARNVTDTEDGFLCGTRYLILDRDTKYSDEFRAPSFESPAKFTRRIIGVAVQAGVVDGPAIYRMFNHAIAGAMTLPQHLSTDHDPLFQFHRWRANLRILDVTDVKTIPHVPLSHPFIERLIGTLRRELLDQIPFWGAGDLQRKLLHFRDYYNHHRVHASLDGLTPTCKTADANRCVIGLKGYQWRSHCRGLYQLPVAA